MVMPILRNKPIPNILVKLGPCVWGTTVVYLR